MTTWRPDIFEYMSFRAFLSDYYKAAKQHTKGFSYRAFSKKAGFSSTNFIKMVIDGDRNLGPESAAKIADAMALSAAERRFFEQLVELEQSDDPDEPALDISITGFRLHLNHHDQKCRGDDRPG